MSADALAPITAITAARMTASTITELIEREAPGLLGYFVRRTESADDAADLLGDTLIVLWRRKSSIPADDVAARMWSYGVARKVLSGHRRGSRRRTALGERLRAQIAINRTLPTGDEHPASGQVNELIETLTEVDREIIRLAYWEGFSLAEISGIMSMRPGTVRSRHARAIGKLREGLGSARVSAD